MTVHLTVISGNDLVIDLVRDFAHGLGCGVETVPALAVRSIRITVPDAGHVLVELLTHVALSATKAGIDVSEPLCQVTCQHSGVASEVRLAIRLAEFRIESAAAAAG
jgi:hypothetical protein